MALPAATMYLTEPTWFIAIGAAYLLAVYALRAWMRERSPMTLKFPMRLYNVAQILLCGYMTAGFWREMSQAPKTVDVYGMALPNLFALSLPRTRNAEYFVLVHCASKVLDFFDTFFIVLRKSDKQLSFLHLYHHATIGGIWGLLLYLDAGWGTAMWGAWINSLTHVFMYTHYLVSSFGIRHPFKSALTMWQIGQFYFCVAHAVAVGILGLDAFYSRKLALIQLGYQLTMIVLFSNFYKRSYSKPAGDTTATAVVAPQAADAEGGNPVCLPAGSAANVRNRTKRGATGEDNGDVGEVATAIAQRTRVRLPMT